MPLVPAKCPECGGNIEVNPSADAAVCKFCGTPFIVENAINNYNVTNNITAGVVNVTGEKDFVIRAGILEKYNGESTDVVIPNNVIKINYGGVFKGMPIKSVVIPDSVTSIGADAFAECPSLTSITIPNSVTSIGKGTFYECTNLTSITIPNSVTSIGDYAFAGCTSLTSITIPNSVTKIEKDAFTGCTSLTSITIPNSVTKIEEFAFSKCTNLASMTIPDSVTSIGDFAFYLCDNLTQINCNKWFDAFWDTPYGKNLQALRRRSHGLCQHCGGSFKGVFNKVCSKCGKPKDY